MPVASRPARASSRSAWQPGEDRDVVLGRRSAEQHADAARTTSSPLSEQSRVVVGQVVEVEDGVAGPERRAHPRDRVVARGDAPHRPRSRATSGARVGPPTTMTSAAPIARDRPRRGPGSRRAAARPELDQPRRHDDPPRPSAQAREQLERRRGARGVRVEGVVDDDDARRARWRRSSGSRRARTAPRRAATSASLAPASSAAAAAQREVRRLHAGRQVRRGRSPGRRRAASPVRPSARDAHVGASRTPRP